MRLRTRGSMGPPSSEAGADPAGRPSPVLMSGVAGNPLMEARRISKSFSGSTVLDCVDFDVRVGEVHAVVGENGAGKSTLMNILSGVLRPDSGEMRWEGRPIHLSEPRDAHQLGISFVHQEL